MLDFLAIKMIVKGISSHSGPLLLVANHMSWLDITAMHAARFCRFISKSDVKAWPVVGALASGIGTLFIERESRRDARRVVQQMTERLSAGDVLAVFPEGTTGDGSALLPFHGNLLQSAITVDAPVQPVALSYVNRKTLEPTREPCYVGDDTLAGSVWRTVMASDLCVCVTFGELQQVQGRDRRTWAVDLRESIGQLRQTGFDNATEPGVGP
jgi:1-acyl-sn-glycerol-3-phosphate acyltransferase